MDKADTKDKQMRDTSETASLVAKARVSAQETTPGQVFSSSDLINAMTSSPFSDRLGGASFSDEV